MLHVHVQHVLPYSICQAPALSCRCLHGHGKDIVRRKECVHSTLLHASQQQHVQHNKYSILLHANFSPGCKIGPSQTERCLTTATAAYRPCLAWSDAHIDAAQYTSTPEVPESGAPVPSLIHQTQFPCAVMITLVMVLSCPS